MDEQLFLTTRALVDRSARAHDGDPLLVNALYDASWHVLEGAQGPHIDESAPFPAMLWLGGATDTYNGRAFTGSLGHFVLLLNERAKYIAPKRMGWIIEPTTNPTGRRTNQATLAVHALFLDVDGTGEWHSLLNVLDDLNFAFVVYQSGGWSPSTPKWRLVLPLSAPFDTSSEPKQAAWKAIYNHARVIFGALAQLRGVGFDPATETPCNPWFLTERRQPDDSIRVVQWQKGHTLDLTALALALPAPPPGELYTDHESVSPLVGAKLADAQIKTLVEALTVATTRVPIGRRDLYLALTGALLDRGVSPDDALVIIEAVSANYPRKHPEKHKDNVHNARTTISRWVAGERVTRIGTLNAVAPSIAHVLDLILPGAAQRIAASMNQIIAESSTAAAAPPAAPQPPSTPLVKLRRGPLSELGKEISSIARRLPDKYAAERIIIQQFLAGALLPANALTNEIIGRAMRVLGLYLQKDTRWIDVLDFAGPSLGTFTQQLDSVAFIERAFYDGRAKLLRSLQKKALAAQPFFQAREALFKDIK